MVPKTCVFGLFEALWSRNHSLDADFAPRDDSNAITGTARILHVIAHGQRVTSDQIHARAADLGNRPSGASGRARVSGISPRNPKPGAGLDS